MSDFSFSPATSSASSSTPELLEMEAFASLTEAAFRCGRNYQLKFDPTVFWANAAIISRFPLHTVVARSYFSALLHEATCERTFSYTGRLLTKQRVQLDPDQVCASAVCTAGEAVYEEIKRHYQSKREANK
jgi:hypothetical protein